MRILTGGLLVAVVVVAGGQHLAALNRPKLQTGPLVEQAVDAYRKDDAATISAVRDQIDALTPAGASYSDLTACTADGYLLRRIETAKVIVDYLNEPAVQGMGDVPRLVYLDDYPKGINDTMVATERGWPSHDDCRKVSDDGPGWHMQDDRENGYAAKARLKVAEQWRAELEKDGGPETLKEAEARARTTLAVNHVIEDEGAVNLARNRSMARQR